MQENVAKFVVITTIFIAFVIIVLFLFNAELTPFFDNLTDFFKGIPDSKDFNLPTVEPKDFDS